MFGPSSSQIWVFQSAPPRRGRRAAFGEALQCGLSFNPRPREGGDARPASARRRSGSFNPRPREGGDHRSTKWTSATRSFNPRPREGGDEPGEPPGDGACVSIRAPAKGATGVGRGSRAIKMFQSAPPRRGRRSAPAQRDALAHVSIRAPAKGATSCRRRPRGCRSRFNPRPREGGDVRLPAPSPSPASFQSAPPRRGRHVAGVVTSTTPGVSIRAPAKGATDQHLHHASSRPVSIRAPAKGATCRGRPVHRDQSRFNPPPRRGRPAPGEIASCSSSFNAPPRRGRPPRASARG